MDTEPEKINNNEMTQLISNLSETSDTTTVKETIEDRYNKLRGFAVKLKKKVSDLTEQIQILESEKQKVSADKEELQNKIIHISDNAKKLQAIQAEYDKLQDKTEQSKSENKKLMKNLEVLVNDNASLKQSLFQENENVLSLTAVLEQLTKEKKKLEFTCKQSAEEIKKLKNEIKADLVIKEQSDKEYEEMKTNLESEVKAHTVIKNQLDAIKQEQKNSSVLSLEVQNYEKSIQEMKIKLSEESSKRQLSEKTIDEHLETIIILNKQISELRNNCLSKSNQMTSLGEKNEAVKAELCEAKYEIRVAQRKIEEFTEKLEALKTEKQDLCNKLDSLASEKNDILKESVIQKENNEKQMKDLSTEIARLNELLTESKQETETLQEEFNGYKLRAQSVLRTQQSSKNTGSKGKNIIEMEEELEHAQLQNVTFREKCESYRQRMESLTNELIIIKEERDHMMESRKELNQKVSNLRQDLVSLIEQNKAQELKIQQLQMEYKKETENLENLHKVKMEELKNRYREEIRNLKSEMEKSATNGSEKTENSNSGVEKSAELNYDINHFSRIAVPLIEREECEGSESVDSCSQVPVNEERYRRHSLMPLDELLNSSDDYGNYETRTLSTKVSRHELEACELRIKHLTALLADAERDMAKLTQLNELLKEDIRRQQRSTEREQHANNFEYLKNVVFKFVTLKNGDERSHLIPVLTTILKLSPEETQKLNTVAGVAGKSWIPGIPGWHNS